MAIQKVFFTNALTRYEARYEGFFSCEVVVENAEKTQEKSETNIASFPFPPLHRVME